MRSVLSEVQRENAFVERERGKIVQSCDDLCDAWSEFNCGDEDCRHVVNDKIYADLDTRVN